MNERRISRLQQLIKARAAEVIQQELSDPRAGMITITKVKLDKEMMSCRIFWSVFGPDSEMRTTERMLQDARGYIQREIAKVLTTRTVPHVEFQHDESIAGSIRLQEILKDIKDDEAAASDGDRDGDEGTETGGGDEKRGGSPTNDGP